MATEVIIRTTRRNDVTLALVGLLIAPLALAGWLVEIADVRAEGIAALQDASVSAAFQNLILVAAPVMAVWSACLGIGAAWRLLDRRPAIRADSRGLAFHPSVHAPPISWNRVKSVDVVLDGRLMTFEITLDRRFWSLLMWRTSRRVVLHIVGIGLSVEEAQDLALRMNAWRLAAAS